MCYGHTQDREESGTFELDPRGHCRDTDGLSLVVELGLGLPDRQKPRVAFICTLYRELKFLVLNGVIIIKDVV